MFYLKVHTTIIQLSPQGGLFKTRPSREAAYSRGGLIQKSGKYVAKRPKKCLEVLKDESDKMAIKLNYMKLDIGVIMQKYSKELLINGFSFLTESGRILTRGLFERGAYLKE